MKAIYLKTACLNKKSHKWQVSHQALAVDTQRVFPVQDG